MIPKSLYETHLETSQERTREYAEFRDDEGSIDPFYDEDEDEDEWPEVDLGGFPTGLDLIGVCFRVVWKDKEILAYQAASIIMCVSFLAAFLFAVFPNLEQETLERNLNAPVLIVKLFPYYILASFIGTYFSAATIAVATIRMKGGNPKFADGLEAATKKIPSILGWAVVTAVVGVFLTLLRRKGRGARLASNAAQLAWGIATYFVVPVMLFEDEGPISAIHRSTSIVRRTWRESLAGNFGMGIVFFLLAILGMVVGFVSGSLLGGTLGGIVGLVALLVVVLVFASAAGGVLVAALYRMARTGRMPEIMEGYDEFGNAFRGISLRQVNADARLSPDELTRIYAR